MLLFVKVVVLHIAGNFVPFQIGIVFFASLSGISRHAFRRLSILFLKRIPDAVSGLLYLLVFDAAYNGG